MDGPQSDVLWLLNIRKYNLHKQASLTTQTAIDMGSNGDHRRQQTLRTWEEELVYLIQGSSQPSFIYPLPRPLLVIFIKIKYVHSAEVLLQHGQALVHAHHLGFQREVEEFFEENQALCRPSLSTYLHDRVDRSTHTAPSFQNSRRILHETRQKG